MNITELIKAKAIPLPPIKIYALQKQLGIKALQPHEAAELWDITEAQYWDILEQGRIDYTEYMAKLHFDAGFYRSWNFTGAKYRAQMEALTIAKGARTYAELSEITGIQASRIQRICKGRFIATSAEIETIKAATGYDMSRQAEEMKKEIEANNQTKTDL